MSTFSVFSVEPLRNSHSVISKLIKKFMVNYLLSNRLGTGGAKKEKAFVGFYALLPPGCNVLLNAIEGVEKLPETFHYFSKKAASITWNGNLTNFGLRRMVESE